VVFVLIATPLNLLNLAPFGMMDGARIADALAEGRVARAGARLALVTGLSLSIWGMFGWSDFGPTIGLLAVISLSGFLTSREDAAPLAPMTTRQRALVVSTLALTLCVYGAALRLTVASALGKIAQAETTLHARGGVDRQGSDERAAYDPRTDANCEREGKASSSNFTSPGDVFPREKLLNPTRLILLQEFSSRGVFRCLISVITDLNYCSALHGAPRNGSRWRRRLVADVLAPLGRRKFTSRARIAATPEKIWNAYVLGPRRRTAGAGPRKSGRANSSRPPVALTVRDAPPVGPEGIQVRRLRHHGFRSAALVRRPILSIDGVATEPGKAGRERLLLTPVGQSTQASLTFEVSVRGLYNLLHLRHFFRARHGPASRPLRGSPHAGAARGLGWKPTLPWRRRLARHDGPDGRR